MSTSASKTLTIINKLGLHARAATKLVELTANYPCTITVECGGKSAKANSVMALLLLAGAKGKQVHIKCEGEQAHDALAAVEALFENRFEESE